VIASNDKKNIFWHVCLGLAISLFFHVFLFKTFYSQKPKPSQTVSRYLEVDVESTPTLSQKNTEEPIIPNKKNELFWDKKLMAKPKEIRSDKPIKQIGSLGSDKSNTTKTAQVPLVTGLPLEKLSTPGQGGVEVPIGNTILPGYSPNQTGPVRPLPSGDGQGGIGTKTTPIFQSGDEESLQSLPEHNIEACEQKLKKAYDDSGLASKGVFGDICFNVTVEANGKVSKIKLVSPRDADVRLVDLFKGVFYIAKECSFTKPALDKNGTKVRFLITQYKASFLQDKD